MTISRRSLFSALFGGLGAIAAGPIVADPYLPTRIILSGTGGRGGYSGKVFPAGGSGGEIYIVGNGGAAGGGGAR